MTHMIPSYNIEVLNLTQALMDPAMERIGSETNRLEKLQLSHDIGEGFQATIQRFTICKSAKQGLY